MHNLLIKNPRVWRYLDDLGYVRGPLKNRLDSLYNWGYGFYDREIDANAIRYLFGTGWRIDTTVFQSDDLQPWTGPWVEQVHWFFDSPKPHQKYMVVAAVPFISIIHEGSYTGLDWSSRSIPTYGLKFWEGEDGKIEAERVL